MSTPRPASGRGGTQGGLGLPRAIALVMGSIMGTGLFALPAEVAPFGMLAVVTLLIVTVGALALAVMFGSLAKRISAPGGPFAYSRYYFGDFAGFTSAWPYWVTSWVGNAGIVAIWVIYVQALFGLDQSNTALAVAIALIGLWIPAAVNLTGIRNVGVVQVVMTTLTFVPIVVIATVGVVVAVTRGQFPPFNPSGEDVVGAISSCATLVLFSFLGVEVASVATRKINNPTRNVPIATIAGTVACGLAYLLCLIAVFGIVPYDVLTSRAGEASFSLAFHEIFGIDGSGHVMSFFAVIAGLGALNGWTLICAAMPRAAAEEGLFPAFFAKVNRADVPYWGVILSACLASAVVIFSFLSTAGIQVLNTLILLSGVAASVPYFLSAMAQLYYLLTKRRIYNSHVFARAMLVAIMALLFSFWIVFGSGSLATYYAVLLFLLGYVVLLGLYVKRKRAGGVVQGDSSGPLSSAPG